MSACSVEHLLGLLGVSQQGDRALFSQATLHRRTHAPHDPDWSDRTWYLSVPELGFEGSSARPSVVFVSGRSGIYYLRRYCGLTTLRVYRVGSFTRNPRTLPSATVQPVTMIHHYSALQVAETRLS